MSTTDAECEVPTAGTETQSDQSLLAYTWYVLRSNPLTLVGSSIVLSVTLIAILAPLLAPYDPIAAAVGDRLQPPSRIHPMGTDNLGMDILSRVVFAARVDLLIAFSAVALAVAIGSPLGALIGYAGGWVDEVAMRIVDGMNAFPSFILALLIAAVLGSGVFNIVAVVAFVNIPGYLRLVRGEVLSLKERQFTEAARAVGNPSRRIVFRHILPNTIGPILVNASLNLAWAILTAAALSYLGVGVPLPTPEWGLMVRRGTRFIPSGEWWISFFPGLSISLLVFGFNLVGDSIEDVVDPRRRYR